MSKQGSGKQTKNGRAFEYAIGNALYETLIEYCGDDGAQLIGNPTLAVVYKHFMSLSNEDQSNFKDAANVAIKYIISLEKKLITPISDDDVLKIQFIADNAGQIGDVRDIKISREKQNYEIGFSGKNNHKALKNSRLSDLIDFGEKWVNIPCSQIYFDEMKTIFSNLRTENLKKTTWKSLLNKENDYYLPALKSFKKEIELINSKHNIANILFKYLLGKQDYYKIIKQDKLSEVEISGFNIYGTLSTPQIFLPTKLDRVQFKSNVNNRLLLICDNDWVIDFRIHSAKSIVEPSLKFDINLEGNPPIPTKKIKYNKYK